MGSGQPRRTRVQPVAELRRHARGWYEQLQTDPTEYPIGNFPLVNVTSPDFRRHPLFKYARFVTIDVPEGSALVLPAYWYHQVESGTACPGQLNVAINYWFSTGTAHQSLHKRLRDHLRVEGSNGEVGVPATKAKRLSQLAQGDWRRIWTCDQWFRDAVIDLQSRI